MAVGEEQLRKWMLTGLGGNAAAHGALRRALAPMLRAFFRRRMGDDPMIEDLMQEVLIAVHRKRATCDPTRPFGGWLYAVARYKMIDHIRRSGRECPLDGFGDVLAAPETADSGDAAPMSIRCWSRSLPSRPPRSAPPISMGCPWPRRPSAMA